MTQEEIRYLTELKTDTALWLSDYKDELFSRYKLALVNTDKRIAEYVAMVIANPDSHNLYELLKLKRFFDMLDGYYWDENGVHKFLNFCES
ncbi:MAG: hypothetical protein LUC37_05355, partial [Prevotella sp.]|nr:hypothetical protein [Prevotella sp.]